MTLSTSLNPCGQGTQLAHVGQMSREIMVIIERFWNSHPVVYLDFLGMAVAQLCRFLKHTIPNWDK